MSANLTNGRYLWANKVLVHLNCKRRIYANTTHQTLSLSPSLPALGDELIARIRNPKILL